MVGRLVELFSSWVWEECLKERRHKHEPRDEVARDGVRGDTEEPRGATFGAAGAQHEEREHVRVLWHERTASLPTPCRAPLRTLLEVRQPSVELDVIARPIPVHQIEEGRERPNAREARIALEQLDDVRVRGHPLEGEWRRPLGTRLLRGREQSFRVGHFFFEPRDIGLEFAQALLRFCLSKRLDRLVSSGLRGCGRRRPTWTGRRRAGWCSACRALHRCRSRCRGGWNRCEADY